MGVYMVLEEALASRHILDHLNRLEKTHKREREREIK